MLPSIYFTPSWCACSRAGVLVAFAWSRMSRDSLVGKAANRERWARTACRITLIREIHINPVSLDQAGFLIDILLMAKVSVLRQLFADILSLIARLRAPPVPA